MANYRKVALPKAQVGSAHVAMALLTRQQAPRAAEHQSTTVCHPAPCQLLSAAPPHAPLQAAILEALAGTTSTRHASPGLQGSRVVRVVRVVRVYKGLGLLEVKKTSNLKPYYQYKAREPPCGASGSVSLTVQPALVTPPQRVQPQATR